MPVVGTTEEGSKELKEVMGEKAFPYTARSSAILVGKLEPMRLLNFHQNAETKYAISSGLREAPNNPVKIQNSWTRSPSLKPSVNRVRDHLPYKIETGGHAPRFSCA